MASPTGVTITEEGKFVSSEELAFIDLATIKIATNDFSDSNKLGKGGFGTVYKVILCPMVLILNEFSIDSQDNTCI